jgi:3-hydroxyisobutyrate dehydrogenase-like beta-hydroxyacid dehydrogenase
MIGAGAMGSALLERLKLAGVQATVYDVYAPALEAAVAAGHTAGGSPADVARAATIVDVIVRTDQDVLDCMLGDDGVLAGARPGTLVLLHSTIDPRTTRQVAEAAAERGVQVLDACIRGMPHQVRAGEAVFLVGGPPEVVDRARPHLLRMGREIMYMGPLCAGNVAKIIKNLLTGAPRLLIFEALLIGEAGGINYLDSLRMFQQLANDSTLEHWETVFDPSGATPLPATGSNILHKDIPLAAQLADALEVDAPITRELAAAGLRIIEAQEARAAATAAPNRPA